MVHVTGGHARVYENVPQRAHKPTEKTRTLSGHGIPRNESARAVGVTGKTSREHSPDEELCANIARNTPDEKLPELGEEFRNRAGAFGRTAYESEHPCAGRLQADADPLR
jgi:hypothetical protein